MKLTTIAATLKTRTVKILAATALAGAALTAAVPAAQAQRVVVGVGFGGPRYFAPPPPVFYGRPVYRDYGYGWRHDDWRYRHDFHHGYYR